MSDEQKQLPEVKAGLLDFSRGTKVDLSYNTIEVDHGEDSLGTYAVFWRATTRVGILAVFRLYTIGNEKVLYLVGIYDADEGVQELSDVWVRLPL